MGTQEIAEDSVGGSGSVVAFADFYASEYPAAVRFAWLLTHDHSMAEDVVQDAFVRLSSKFGAVDAPRAYLRRSVVNGCRDRHRRRQRSDARLRLVAATEPTKHSDHPSELLDAVALLPYRQRVVVVLRYWADLPEAEIADAIRVRPATVRTLAWRAMSTLRKELSHET